MPVECIDPIVCIDPVDVICIDPVEDDPPTECVNGAIASAVVALPPMECIPGGVATAVVTIDTECVPMAIINNGSPQNCSIGSTNTIELVNADCCASIGWFSSSAGVVFSDPNANPTSFVITADGDHSIGWTCC